VADPQLASKSTADSADVKPAAQQAPAGAGVAALEALLAKGMPKTGDVVAVIDAHRSDRDAMLMLLQQRLGNGYVQQVIAAMNHLRVSIPNKEVVAGDPSNPKGNYFDASAEQEGASWRDGNFSGKVDKSGLDATEKLGAKDDLHAKVDADTQQGTLAWEHGGKSEGELFGGTTSTGWDAGVRRNDTVGGGTLTSTAEYVSNKGVGTEQIDEKYVNGTTKLEGTAGLSQGKATASLDASHGFANGSNVHGNVTHTGAGTTAVVDGTDKIDSAHSLTGSASYSDTAKGSSEALKLGYTDPNLSVNGSLDHSSAGTTATLAGTDKLDKTHTLTGSASYSDTPKGQTGSLKAGYTAPNLTLAGSLDRTTNSTQLGFNGDWKHGKNDLSGSLTETVPDNGASETELKLHDSYGNKNVAGTGDFQAGYGSKDYAKATGGLDLQLHPGMYASTWGSVDAEQGKKTTGSLGASLTLTSDEKNALTLAGIINSDGSFETRLQYDLFKDKLDGVSTLSKEKKDALLSVFVSYTSKGTPGMLNDQLGAPEFGEKVGGGAVMAGIRIKF
jgi:hypothetical protein